jgi:hypothetical protein
MGKRPDWDVCNPVAETASGAKALEQHQLITHTLHEAGGLVVGGTDCGGLSYPPSRSQIQHRGMTSECCTFRSNRRSTALALGSKNSAIRSGTREPLNGFHRIL